jgi:hypothetical protein
MDHYTRGGLAIHVAEMALISTEGAYHHIHPWTCRLKRRDKVVVFVTIQALAWYPERTLAERLRRCNAEWGPTFWACPARVLDEPNAKQKILRWCKKVLFQSKQQTSDLKEAISIPRNLRNFLSND